MPKRSTIATSDEAYEAAVRLLARKARTTAEVAAALEAKGVERGTIESVVGRLQSHRHLDDAALAGDQAFALVAGKGLAPAAAVQMLVQRGLPDAVAREAVEAAREGQGEVELCTQALNRRLKGRRCERSATTREGRALARLGYDEDVVLRVLARALETE